MFYSTEHEWISIDGNVATIGITPYASQQLGDIVFVELPTIGSVLTVGDPFAVAESVKAASDVYSPVDGEVVDINEALETSPNLVNDAADSDGWFIKVTLKDPSQLDDLMSKEEYEAFLRNL